MRISFKQSILLLCLMLPSFMAAQVTADNCEEYRAEKGFPDYYCDCKFDYTDFELPLDTTISQPIWYRAFLSELSDGLSAYLHSEGDFSFEAYTSCTAKEPMFQAVFSKNNANSIDSQTIQEKIEENDIGGVDVAFYICITPLDGTGGRVICTSQAEGFHSTCNDALRLFPGMKLLSSNPHDVYVVDPNEVTHGLDMFFQWENENTSPCQLYATLGECDATPFDETTLQTLDDYFVLTADHINSARENGELIYLHFEHDATTNGFIHCLAYDFYELVLDTTICQGIEFRYEDIITTTSGLYFYDTIKAYMAGYECYGFNVIFTEPETQYDTLSLRTTQLPYDYRGQTIEDFGEYDLLIQTSGECDEHILLHAKHNLTTIASAEEVSLCQGNVYEAPDGKQYIHDVILIDSTWQGLDTVYVHQTSVHFNPMEIIFDTVLHTKAEISNGVRYYWQRFYDFGDYKCITTDQDGCIDSVYLHIGHKITVQTQLLEEDLCVGKQYVHTNGLVCDTPTTFIDTTWVNDDTQLITTTQVTFTPSPPHYDTLSVTTTQLPIIYHGDTIHDFGDHSLVIHTAGECDEYYHLHLSHHVDTLYQSVDTTLCQGMAYDHHGLSFTLDTVLVYQQWLDPDTWQITTTYLTFTAPELQYDTIYIKTSDLPYSYRDAIIHDFGTHDLLLHTPGECDEHYMLYAIHVIDTLTHNVDTTLCQGMAYDHHGQSFTLDTVLVYQQWLDPDTWQVTTTYLTFIAPELQHDTIYIKTSDLPYSYRDAIIHDFGTHDLLLHTPGECDEHYMLYAIHTIDTLTHNVDTTLCQGRIFEYQGEEYTEDASLENYTQINADTCQLTIIHLAFDRPEMEYDSLLLTTEQLTNGYYYEPADTLIHAAGEYFFEILAYNQCTRYLTLTVSVDPSTQLETTTILTRPQLMLYRGRVIIVKGDEWFTVLGEKVQ